MRPRGVLMAGVVAGAVLVAALPASAEVVRLANGRTVSYQPLRGELTVRPFDKLFSNLDYNGGPVMASNTNYTVYWRPTGAPAYPSDYQPGVNQYMEDLAHDSGGHENVDSISTQYNDAAGELANYDAHFGGALIDTDPYPANGCFHAAICLTDAQLREELVSFVNAHGLPHDLAHEYFLLTPPGVEDCFEEAGSKSECSAGAEPSVAEYCAYHSNIPLGGEGEIIYSNDPYVTGNVGCDDGNHPNGHSSDGVIEGGLSHEHNESVTDPEPNNAWTDFGGVGGENGDKCRTFSASTEFGTPLGEVEVGGKKYKYNQVINGHFYWYQQEWSNKGHECRQRLTFKAEEAPTATFTGVPVEEGNEVKFSASGSTPGAGGRYNWQFNDLFGSFPNTPVESEESTVFHKFPFAGTYTVALTVFKSDGTSSGAARTLTVGKTQTISFSSAAPTGATVNGRRYTAVATATSGLPVTLTIEAASSSVCAISGSTVSFLATGTCTIDADQEGDVEYNPAPQVQQSFAVGRARSISSAPPPPEPPPPAPIVLVPNSNFTLAATTKNGGITLRFSISDPGTMSWLLTFQNGKFGVFAARASKCKKGYLSLKGRCRPSKIVYAKGRKAFVSGGVVTFTIRPTRSALAALKNALKRKKGLSVTITLTFQSSRGGSPASQTRTIIVRLRKSR